MKLLNVEIQGFGSYHATQSLDFESLTPGLYHVAGVNKKNLRLEGNAVGKSKLFEAVCWCLFGKTSRNLKAGTVRGWYTKEDCIVALRVQTRKDKIEIVRAWSPNVLAVSVNGTTTKPIEQSELEQLLGVNFDAFLFSYYHAQFTPKFLDLAPSAQLDLYTQATKLDFWEEASTFAGKAASTTREALQEAKELLAGAKEKVASYKAFSYKKEEAAWTAQHTKKAQDLQDALRKEEAKVAACQKALVKAKAQVVGVKDLSQEIAHTQAFIRQQQTALNALEQAYAKAERTKEGKCPNCGQPITKQHLEKELTRLVDEGTKIDVETAKAQKKVQALFAEQEKIEPLEGAITEATADLRVAGTKLAESVRQSKALLQETNPYTAKQAALEQELKEARSTLAEAEKAGHPWKKRSAHCRTGMEGSAKSVLRWSKNLLRN